MEQNNNEKNLNNNTTQNMEKIGLKEILKNPKLLMENDKYFLIVFAIIVIICVLGWFFVANIINSSDNNSVDTSDVWVCAKKYVETQLKSPSTSKFCSSSSATITSKGKNKYTVSGYVDAQNSFGAISRQYFTVTLTMTKTGYSNASILWE